MIVRFKCGHEGCTETVRYDADNRRDAVNLADRYSNGRWRCVRHTRPEEVLSNQVRAISSEMKVIEEPHGLYWGKDTAFSGFAHGPGFKAFAEDFPPGTILRVTAEIITSEDKP